MCFGSVRGFKYLPREIQRERIDFIDRDCFQRLVAGDPSIIVFDDLVAPSSVSIAPEPIGNGFRLMSAQAFKSGDTIFTNKTTRVPVDAVVILIVLGHRRWFGLGHFAQEKEFDTTKHFFGFDSFQNHSCEPNTVSVFYNPDDKTEYRLVALTDIAPGDELTCDYETLGDYCETRVIPCRCGTPSCRGTIKE